MAQGSYAQSNELCLLRNIWFPNMHELRGWHKLRDVFTCLSLLNVCASD